MPIFLKKAVSILIWGLAIQYFLTPILFGSATELTFINPPPISSFKFYGSINVRQNLRLYHKHRNRREVSIGQSFFKERRCLRFLKMKPRVRIKTMIVPKEKRAFQSSNNLQPRKGILFKTDNQETNGQNNFSFAKTTQNLQVIGTLDQASTSKRTNVFTKIYRFVVKYGSQLVLTNHLFNLVIIVIVSIRQIFFSKILIMIFAFYHFAFVIVFAIAVHSKIRKMNETLKMSFWKKMLFIFDNRLMLEIILLISSVSFLVAYMHHIEGALSSYYLGFCYLKFLALLRILISKTKFKTLQLYLSIVSECITIFWIFIFYMFFNFISFQVILLVVPFCLDELDTAFRFSMDHSQTKSSFFSMARTFAGGSFFDQNLYLFLEFLINEWVFVVPEHIKSTASLFVFQSLVAVHMFLSKFVIAPLVFKQYLKVNYSCDLLVFLYYLCTV